MQMQTVVMAIIGGCFVGAVSLRAFRRLPSTGRRTLAALCGVAVAVLWLWLGP